MNNYEELSIEKIGDGKALEKINFEIGRAIANCLDPNTDPKAKRKVTLKLVLIPTQERDSAIVTYQAESKLCPDFVGVETVYLTKDGAAFVNTSKQMSIDEALQETADKDGVVTMPERANGND